MAPEVDVDLGGYPPSSFRLTLVFPDNVWVSLGLAAAG